MIYQLTIHSRIAGKWATTRMYVHDFQFQGKLPNWLMHHHDEIIHAEYHHGDRMYLNITFKSEAHFTWFLLQQ
jgi:hypothetical protein